MSTVNLISTVSYPSVIIIRNKKCSSIVNLSNIYNPATHSSNRSKKIRRNTFIRFNFHIGYNVFKSVIQPISLTHYRKSGFIWSYRIKSSLSIAVFNVFLRYRSIRIIGRFNSSICIVTLKLSHSLYTLYSKCIAAVKITCSILHIIFNRYCSVVKISRS